jgi:hypothetical protein
MKHTSWLSGLVRGAQSEPHRDGPHAGLVDVTDRQNDARQLGLAQHVEHVGLVLERSAPRAMRRVAPPTDTMRA